MTVPEGTDLTTSEGTQLRARGVPVTLADGQVWHLRFGMEALLRLEEDYGSIGAVQDRFTEIMGQAGNPGVLRALTSVLVPGLLEAAEDAGVPEGRIVRLLDPGAIGEYMAAFQSAISQAFPNAAAAAAAPASSAGRGKGRTVAKPAKKTTVSSPGPTGTTSRPAGTAVAIGSSGG